MGNYCNVVTIIWLAAKTAVTILSIFIFCSAIAWFDIIEQSDNPSFSFIFSSLFLSSFSISTPVPVTLLSAAAVTVCGGNNFIAGALRKIKTSLPAVNYNRLILCLVNDAFIMVLLLVNWTWIFCWIEWLSYSLKVPTNWLRALFCNEKREIAASKLSNGKSSSFNPWKAFCWICFNNHTVVVNVRCRELKRYHRHLYRR